MSKFTASPSPVFQALRFGAIMMTGLVVATAGLFVVMF
jgi:hypothetical protein